MDINAILKDLEDQRYRVNRAIEALEGTASNGRRERRRAAVRATSNGRRRRLSAVARRRMSEAAKARWAKAKKAGRNRL